MYFLTTCLFAVAENSFILLAVKASLTGLCLVPEFPSLKEIACWHKLVVFCQNNGIRGRFSFWLQDLIASPLESVLWKFGPKTKGGRC